MVDNDPRSILKLWALVFLVLAVIAAIYGMAGDSAGAVRISLILFALFLALMVGVFLIGRRPAA
ncbi:MAG TPA: DUF1328 domain-containing protein [Deltaproteobacteria bacterium]|nr:DUF1328 domain-containing protein [Deltaproteobacteria bacterium]